MVLALISFSTAYSYAHATLSLPTTDVWTQLHDFHSSDQSSYLETLKKGICQHCHLTLITSEIRSIKPEQTLTKMFAVHSEMLLIQTAGFYLANRNTFLKSVIYAVHLVKPFRSDLILRSELHAYPIRT